MKGVWNREVWREGIIDDVGISTVRTWVRSTKAAFGIKRPYKVYLIIGSGCAEVNVGTF